MNLQERIMNHVQIDENGCWNWTGAKSRQGYGKIGIGSRRDGTRRTAKAHRISYTTFVGKIPQGYDICHKRRK